MPNINSLTSINIRDLADASQRASQKQSTGESEGRSFGDTIGDFLKTVNESQKESADAVTDIIQGKSENLHEAMAQLEESRLSFQLMLEIRNKLLESYQEIKRLQV
jgi:flagellar hook-basal body complex protein FliE